MSDPATPAATPSAPLTPAQSVIESIYGKPAPATPAAPAAAAPVADPPATDTPDPNADPAAVPPDPAAPIEETTEEVELSTVAELAEHLEVEPDWLKNLKVSEKVNGAEVQFSIAEALATHRKVQAADTYLADAKTKSKALIDEASQQKQAWAGSVAEIGVLLKEVEDDITRESAELTDKLKRTDPAVYAVKQNEIRERRERLAGLRKKAQEGIAAAAQKSAQEQGKLLEERLPQELAVFRERIPDWNVAKDGPVVVKFLADDGFTTEQINSLAYNGKLMSYIVKAMRAENAKTKLDATKKKVVKIPKILKPGPKSNVTPKPNGAAKTDAVSILYG